MSKACLHCGAETTNPKFCNHSCSASYTNKNRAIVNKCKNCNLRAGIKIFGLEKIEICLFT